MLGADGRGPGPHWGMRGFRVERPRPQFDGWVVPALFPCCRRRWVEAVAVPTRRTPIPGGYRRVVPQVAAAGRIRRRARSRSRAMWANHGWSWLGAQGMAWRAAGERVGSTFPDAAPHPTALAAEILAEDAYPEPGGRRRAGGEARTGLAAGPFGLGGDPGGTAPTVPHPPEDIPEAALRLAAAPSPRCVRGLGLAPSRSSRWPRGTASNPCRCPRNRDTIRLTFPTAPAAAPRPEDDGHERRAVGNGGRNGRGEMPFPPLG